MLFATLILEREPMQLADLPQAVMNWLQSAGALASLGLFLFFLIKGRGRFAEMFRSEGRKTEARAASLGTLLTVLSWFGFAVLGVMFAASWIGIGSVANALPGSGGVQATLGDYIFAAAGLLALLVVAFPVLRAVLFDIRFARIWAVARLSLKEAVRQKWVAVFGAMAIIFLFADWFVPYKAEDQVRNYVRVLYWSMSPLFLLMAALVGSFSLPADIKSLTIHTVVTKPITKFEVVLGRYLGYAVLLTIALFAVGILSLGYIWRGVTTEAQTESFTARVPIYGFLGFINSRGDSVGREWDYRKYISGQQLAGGGKKQYAAWFFTDLNDVSPGPNNKVRFEFAFDIFRLTKGEENKGVYCTFTFAPGAMPYTEVEKRIDAMRQERGKRGVKSDGKTPGPDLDIALAKEFLVYQIPGFEVTDYHTQSVEVPYELIQKLRDVHAARPGGEGPTAPMQVLVSIDRTSQSQMLGVARHDFYLLAGENWFYANFIKGLIGLWFCVLLVLGVAVACSTYLSGVIAFLCTGFLFFAGLFVPDIRSLAEGRSFGGGPAEALTRILTRTSIAAPLDESSAVTVVRGTDAAFRWWLRLVLNLIPDVSRYDLHQYVANGFNISWGGNLFTDNLLPLLGYLIPWAILAFYLINYREIANPM